MAEEKKLDGAMFPWLAFGHIIPYLDLAKFIVQKGHHISFISTPRNIDRLPKLPPNFASSISLIKIPLPKVRELPEHAQATTDIRNEQMEHLKKAFDGMEFELTRFLERSAPDWIIFDFAPHWLPLVATGLGISRAFFLIINAWFLALFGPLDTLITGSDYRSTPQDFMVPPKWVQFETKVAYRRFEADWMLQASKKNDSGVSDFYRAGKVISGCEAIIVRHCYEFEPEWLDLLQKLYHRPVVPVGLMPPQVLEDNNKGENDETWATIKNWLDGKHKGSVVYVALGLELSGVSFFWVFRQVSESDSVDFPNGFEERVHGRGVVWRSWAPQLKILSHDSIGGWSSIVEGLMFGHPLITLPFLVDQGLNSRVVVDKLLGVEIPRNEQDGSYTSESVANSVLLENEGNEFREKAKKISEIFSDQELHRRYIDNFVIYLENHITKRVTNSSYGIIKCYSL